MREFNFFKRGHQKANPSKQQTMVHPFPLICSFKKGSGRERKKRSKCCRIIKYLKDNLKPNQLTWKLIVGSDDYNLIFKESMGAQVTHFR